ncbi:hypothetical protein WJU23_06980 [Prosthecobacter sp. SYSU 5D2]|uniref:hypothetical protein n=1 Tax=Prosthecobacter sp. SYSU 5D2 TaxID=3134134 RepID=UPI0031FE482F
MKITPLLSLAAVCLLAQCNKSASPVTVMAEPLMPSVPVITANASPHFMKVASQLELGGSAFNYADQEGFMAAVAVMLDDALQNMPAEQRQDVPPGLSFVKLFDAFGLNSVKAMGSSSRLTDSGLYHSRSYAYMPGGRKGLSTLNGAEAQGFLTHEMAPKGTDLALEFPIYLKAIATDSLASFMGMAPAEARAETEAKLAEPIPPLGITVRELIEKLDARLGLFIRVDPEQQMAVPGAEFPLPGVEALIVAEHLGWLLEPLKTQFMPMLLSPALPVEVEDKDGILTITFKMPMGPAPMDFQPVLRFDSKADRLMVATRPAFMSAALEGKELLAADAEFQKAWTGLPDEGNSALYVSPVFLKTLRGMMRQSLALSDEPQASKEMMEKALDFLTPYLAQGQAACTANSADGTLGVANLAFPLGNSSTLATLTTLSIVSSLAVPAFNGMQTKANEAKTGSEHLQIFTALMAYAADNNGQFPATLEELKTEGLLDSSSLTSGTVWLYNPTLHGSSPSKAILLASEPDPDTGYRTVLRVSGITETLTESEFEEQRDENLR